MTDQHPITRKLLRRLRCAAVLCNDAAGVTRFDGSTPDEIERKVQAYTVIGDSTWTYETRGGQQVAWPRMASDPAAAPSAVRPEVATMEQALYMGERIAEMNRRAWAEAYATVGALMKTVIEAQSSALASLSNRVSTQEEQLERQNQSLSQAMEKAQQGELDQTLGKVLDLAVATQAAKAATATAAAAKPAKAAATS